MRPDMARPILHGGIKEWTRVQGWGLAGCLDIGASGEFDSKRGASCTFWIVLDLTPQGGILWP